MEFGSLAFKLFCMIGDAKKHKGMSTPPEIERRDDLSYGPDPKWNRLDLYYPRERTDKLPVIISIHGGGWVYGTKESYQYYCMSLAQRNFAVINFTYRLAPKYKFPCPLEDTNMVIGWVYDHADEYGLDLDKIFFVGDSAGAQLVGLYTSICTNPQYAKKFAFTIPSKFCPKAVAFNCGIYNMHDVIEKNALGLVKGLAKDYLGRKLNPQVVEDNNVVSHMTAKFPPAYIMSATGDFLLDQLPFIEERLTKLGIRYQKKIYGYGSKKLPPGFYVLESVKEEHFYKNPTFDVTMGHLS
jgi:acetyl esterase/lipase